VRCLLSHSSPVPYVVDTCAPHGALTDNLVHQDTRDLDWESKGLKYATINYDEPSTLVDAFRGVEVVISTVAYRAVDQQRQLAQAAKEAGVKTFAPSEYGGETHRVTDHALFLTKKRIHEYLEEIKLPYTLFYTGPTPDFFLSPYVGVPHRRFRFRF